MEGTSPDEVARAVQASVRLLTHRLRDVPQDGDVSLSEASLLARLDHLGPRDAATLARLEGISAQSVGVTIAALAARGLVRRRPDPEDGRRRVVALTPAGLAALRRRRTRRAAQLAAALAEGFSAAERRQLLAAVPLIERLAERL